LWEQKGTGVQLSLMSANDPDTDINQFGIEQGNWRPINDELALKRRFGPSARKSEEAAQRHNDDAMRRVARNVF
jgi:hypothetical protein